jgi:hypothetical protein
MTRQSKLSYMAGFMDGEGSFSITKTYSVQRKKDGSKITYLVYKLWVSVTNTNREVMDWVAKNFGGKVLTGSNKNRNPKHKTRYTWALSSFSDIEKFTLGILPYLIVKRQQALLTLEFCRTGQKTSIGEWLGQEVQQKRDELRREMMRLNGIFPCTPSEPVETSTQGSSKEDEDTVRTGQRCSEADRNDQPALDCEDDCLACLVS